jgi:hypothetical protein
MLLSLNKNARREILLHQQQQLAINELLAKLRSSSTIPIEQGKDPRRSSLIRRRAGCCRWAEATGHVHGGVTTAGVAFRRNATE